MSLVKLICACAWNPDSNWAQQRNLRILLACSGCGNSSLCLTNLGLRWMEMGNTDQAVLMTAVQCQYIVSIYSVSTEQKTFWHECNKGFPAPFTFLIYMFTSLRFVLIFPRFYPVDCVSLLAGEVASHGSTALTCRLRLSCAS